MNEQKPFEKGRFAEEARTEKVINPRKELMKFLLLLSLITAIAVGNLFVRQMPMIKMRTYDFHSPFVFRNVMHDGEMAFKACFRQQLMGFYGYYVCHKFPPAKRYLKDGEYSMDQFKAMFVDPAYVKAFMAKFEKKKAELHKDFAGFRLEHTQQDLKVIPIFVPEKGASFSYNAYPGGAR